uniref:(northern house mosquito) hypothetical protein n=1 Tax=Culex pipiens TaxID=7175 RepID=A0A8D8L3Q4_CULPI
MARVTFSSSLPSLALSEKKVATTQKLFTSPSLSFRGHFPGGDTSHTSRCGNHFFASIKRARPHNRGHTRISLRELNLLLLLPGLLRAEAWPKRGNLPALKTPPRSVQSTLQGRVLPAGTLANRNHALLEVAKCATDFQKFFFLPSTSCSGHTRTRDDFLVRFEAARRFESF